MNRTTKVRSYRRFKASGQAIVVLVGQMIYRGRCGSIESRAECNRVMAEWLTQGGALPPTRASLSAGAGSVPDLTNRELADAYFRHAESHYRENGKPTSEVGMIKKAMGPLCRLYGDTPAATFGPLALKAVRQEFVEAGMCRNKVNRPTRLIVRMFRWAVENEKVPPSVHHGLKPVVGLRGGDVKPANRRRSGRSSMPSSTRSCPMSPGRCGR